MDPRATEEILQSWQQGRLDEAERTCRRYLSEESGNPTIRILLGRLLVARNALDEACQTLTQGLPSQSGFSQMKMDLAKIYIQKREPLSAKPLLDELLDTAPTMEMRARVLSHLGQVHWQLGEHARGLEQFKTALRQSPDDVRLAQRLAQAYCTLGNASAASAILESWRGRGASPPMLSLLALCRYTQDAPNAALAPIEEGLRQFPGELELTFLRYAINRIAGKPATRPAASQIDDRGMLEARCASLDYLCNHLGSAIVFGLETDLMRDAFEKSSERGLILEFGVYQGLSINQIASWTSETIDGFDSFKGLPEDWKPGEHAGAYNAHGRLPPVASNVRLHPGWFKDSLPAFWATRSEPIRYLHIDCDLYSSTWTALVSSKHALIPGSILVFDEYMGYPGYGAHEFKAWQNFVALYGVEYEYISFSLLAKKTAVRICSIGKTGN